MKPEDQHKTLIESKGAHTFVVVLSAQQVLKAESSDLWVRIIIGFLGTIGDRRLRRGLAQHDPNI